MINNTPAISGQAICGQTICGYDPTQGKNKTTSEYGDNPKVSISTGRLLYVHSDISVGAGSYEIGVAHVYSSILKTDINKKFPAMNIGLGWKLNVQQFVERKYNGKYSYIDGMGYIHDFVKFDNTNNRYNDTDGLGLVLYFENNDTIIKDEVGNLMKFDSLGRLYQTVDAYNPSIIKNYLYDANSGRLIEIYDERMKNGSTKKNYIKLIYNDTGYLTTIEVYNQNSAKVMSYGYIYQNDQLMQITKTVTTSKIVTRFIYYENNNRLQYAIDDESNNSISVEYYEDHRVYSLSKGIGTFTCKTSKTFNYNYTTVSEYSFHNNTTITNEKNVKLEYFLNRNGYVVSVLEGASNGKLMTLTKDSGVCLDIGEGSVSINGNKELHIVDDYSKFSTSPVLCNVLKTGEKDYSNYVCSMWLKHQIIIDKPLKLKFRIHGTDQSNVIYYAELDNKAVNAWQYVTFPVKFTSNIKQIRGVNIEIFDAQNNLYEASLCNIRFSAGGSTTQYITRQTTSGVSSIDFDGITKANIVFADNSSKTLDIRIGSDFTFINPDCFFTQSDIVKIFRNYRIAINEMNTGHSTKIKYDVTYCNGTKKLANVTSITFKDANNNLFPIYFDSDGKANCFLRTSSLTWNSRSEQLYYFNDNEMCIKFVESHLNGDYSVAKSSDIYQYIDYKGKLIREKDAYRVITYYDYDANGTLTETRMQHEDGGEMMKYTAVYSDYDGTVASNNSMSSSFATTDSPFGITKTVTQGNYIDEKRQNTSLYEYDSFKEKLKSVKAYNNSSSASGNIVAGNNLTYTNGRLTGVSDDYTSYSFSYNLLGDLSGIKFGATNVLQKEIDYNYGDNGTKVKDSYSNGYVMSSYADKYGRPVKTEAQTSDGTFTTNYNFQSVSESPMAAKIKSINDPYDGSTYTYEYDHQNNPIKWSKSGNASKNSKALEVRQIYTGGTKYLLENNEKFKTEIVYDSDKTIDPRITETKVFYDPNNDIYDDWNENPMYYGLYDYDSLGRLEFKTYLDRELVHSLPATTTSAKFEYKYESLNGISTPLVKTYDAKIGHYARGTYNHGAESLFTYTYDKYGNVTNVTETGKTKDYIFIGSFVRNVDGYEAYHYDSFDRMTYEYNYTRIGGKAAKSISRNFSYTDNGNIKGKLKSITDTLDSNNDCTLSYDSRGQLKTVNYSRTDGTYMKKYEYDGFGNRTAKLEHTGHYQYNYPTNYSWTRGNKLKKIYHWLDQNHTKNVYCDYNHQGVRFKKTLENITYGSNGTTTETVTTSYYLDGSKIIGEDRTDGKKLRYLYDIDGLCGVKYNNDYYQYVRDGRGNVIMVTEREGKVIGRYIYDAWGNCSVYNTDGTLNTDMNSIANVNPFRWKSHYFDAESQFYYANGRYYDPEVGLYVDADDIERIISYVSVIFGLDRNAVMLDNILRYLTNTENIFTSTELSVDQSYDPNDYLSWWAKNWQKVMNTVRVVLFASLLLVSVVLMCIPPTSGFGVGMFLAGMKAAISGAIIGGIIGGIMSAVQGNSFFQGLVEGAVWGFVDGFNTGALLYCASQAISAIANVVNKAKPITSPVADGVEYAAKHGVEIRSANYSEFTDDAQNLIKNLDRGPNGTVSKATTGTKIHQGLKVDGATSQSIKNAGIKGKYGFADALGGNTIYELKPNNLVNIKKAVSQLHRYNNALGGGYRLMILVY